MPFDTYFDLTVRQDTETDIPHWDCMGQVWRIVHVAGGMTGDAFAVAFPEWMRSGFTLGGTLRVFTRGDDAAQRMYDAIEQAPRFAVFAQGSRVRSVKNAQAFEAYKMHRIPSGPSKGRKIIDLQAQTMLRERSRRRLLTQQSSLPFVRMRSSSGRGFRLVIERVVAKADQQGSPNGYGLSRTTQIVALPVVE